MVELSNAEEAWIVAENELRATKQELHDLRRRVSDMASAYIKHAYTVQEKHLTGYKVTVAFEEHDAAIAWFDQLLFLPEFVLPAVETDPLVEIFDECFNQDVLEGETWSEAMARKTKAALDMLGLEIRQKNDG